MKKRSLITMLLLAIVMIFALVGCSNDAAKEEATKEGTEDKATETNKDEEQENEATEETNFPITVKHALGEAVIDSKPERVVTIQWGNQDVVLALGVIPDGFSAANFGVQDDSGLLPWTKAKLDELGAENPNIFQDTDGLDFEAIADAKPDVILAAYSGITQEDYDLLAQIAPVVAYPSAPWVTTWREQIELIAKGMGIEEKGLQLIKDTENLISEKVSKYPQIEGKKVVWVNFSANDFSKLHLYTPADTRVSFLNELGMVYPESITELITDPASYSLSLSSENVEALYDADLIVGYGNEELYEALKADPLLGKIPAIERGSVAFIAADSPIVAAGTPNPLAIAYTIDEYLELIGSAIDKINE